MAPNEDGEKILHELGLTFSQAKLYVALAKFGDYSSTNEIGNFSNVARQDAYRIVRELQEIGLVEKTVATPAKFKAVPMKQVIYTLLEQRKERTLSLMEESTKLLATFPEKKSKSNVQSTQFVLIPKGEAKLQRVAEAIKISNETVLSITPWNMFTQWIFYLNEIWRQAIERGVQFRWITEGRRSSVSDSSVKTVDDFLRANPRFRLRVIPQTPTERLGIFDDRELIIATEKRQNAADSPALCTNNPTMVHILKDYFEVKWKLSKEYKKTEQ